MRTNMRRRQLTIGVISALFLGLLSGCGSDDQSASNAGSAFDNLKEVVSEANTSGSEGEPSSWVKEKEPDEVTIDWAVEPFLEVDDIEVEDACKDPRSKEVAFVKKNELYGMVRYNGLYAVEPYFANMTPDPYSLYNEPEDGSGRFCAHFTEDLKFEFYINDGWGSPAGNVYYYNMTDHRLYLSAYGIESAEVSAPVVVEKAESPGPDVLEQQQLDGKGLFGVADNKGILIECIYEDGYCVEGEDVTYYAMKKNGKWAYFAPNGKQLTDFIYDSFDEHFQSWRQVLTFVSGVEYEDHTMPYLPTEGYIAVQVDGKCGYIDTDLNEVYPLGTFEDVRPVHGGKAWARKDGKWGILNFPTKEVKKVEIRDEDYFQLNSH